MLVGKTLLDEEKVVSLINDIKEKKELRKMNADFVRDQLFFYLKKDLRKASKLNSNFHPKAAVYKTIVKEVRQLLRKVYGQYRISEEIKHRRTLVDDLLKINFSESGQILKKILATHTSTKERIPFYQRLYQKLFAITGKPGKIIDLGCGINPFSIPFMGLPQLTYYAYDISDEETELLLKYFSWLQKQSPYLKGGAGTFDLSHWKALQKLYTADVCFLFKMTDVLDRGKGHKASEMIIRDVPAPIVVVSFPTLTLSGKKMNNPKRKWIELMCQRLKYKFETLEFINEIFYIIKKK